MSTWERNLYGTWLQPSEVPADVYRDFRVYAGSLSVWHIEDDKSNLYPVITALASSRHHVETFDYGLFDQALVSLVGIRIDSSAGTTPMPSANGWHRDLMDLTLDRLTELIKPMFDTMDTARLSEDEILVD